MWSKRVVRRVEVDHVSSPRLNWLAYDETATLKTILGMIPAIETLKSDIIVKLKLLVLRVLDDEAGWNRALIDKCERTVLLCVDLGKFEVDHRFK